MSLHNKAAFLSYGKAEKDDNAIVLNDQILHRSDNVKGVDVPEEANREEMTQAMEAFDRARGELKRLGESEEAMATLNQEITHPLARIGLRHYGVPLEKGGFKQRLGYGLTLSGIGLKHPFQTIRGHFEKVFGKDTPLLKRMLHCVYGSLVTALLPINVPLGALTGFIIGFRQ